MTLALCCGVIGNVIWGASYLFTRIAQQEAPPMVQMSLRFLLAFLLLRELPSWNQLLGGVIVLCGLYLYIQSKRQPAAAVQS